VRGDGQKVTERIPGPEQRRAIDALLRTIRAETLTLPENVIALIPPSAIGYPRTREDFRNRTGVTFDPVSAAESAASLTIGLMLNPERAARLVQYHAEDSSLPSLEEVIDRLLAATWKADPVPGLGAQVQRAVNSAVVYHLMVLAANEHASAQARATALAKVLGLREWMVAQTPADPSLKAFYQFASMQIRRFEMNSKEIGMPKPAELPPGQPI